MAPTSTFMIRPARREDSRRIAELFRISSDGVADYIWSQAAAPGEDALEVGARRYARSGVAFSFENCIVLDVEGKIGGMLHAYVMPPRAPNFEVSEVDPVLAPYARLEIPGSYYISGVAIEPSLRGRGMGRVLLSHAYRRAAELGCRSVSLIVFDANVRARTLYEREGFQVVDRDRIVPHPAVHYEGDALLMEKVV